MKHEFLITDKVLIANKIYPERFSVTFTKYNYDTKGEKKKLRWYNKKK